MMRIYTVLSRLLDYPSEELMTHLDEIQELIASESGLSDSEREAVLKVVAWMQATSLIELQGNYVDTFDHTPEHSLHLTHHSFGESRERGPALVELTEHFKAHGMAAVDGELPDYLPLILEYVTTLDEMQATFFLGETANVLDLLAQSLEKANSPYAPLIRLIERRGRLARTAA